MTSTEIIAATLGICGTTAVILLELFVGPAGEQPRIKTIKEWWASK